MPIKCGMFEYFEFLMQKTICSFYACLGNHFLRVIAYRTKLLLLCAIYKIVFGQIILDVVWFAVKAVAQRFKRIKFFVAKKHIYA